MSYSGPEYWYVIYKAIADFGDLRKEAAEARKDLKDMADASKSASQAETTGATQASEARKKDVQQIQAEDQALRQLGATAKSTNKDLVYGGRNDMQQHLTDVQNELRYTDLLNRSHWMGFSTVQQATAYRQQQLQLALQENKARFGGYLTPDQWLGYLQKEISSYTGEAAVIRARSDAIRESTTAWLAHDNAVAGTNKSIGQLGEGATAVNALSSAIDAIPDTSVTKLVLDDAGFRAQLAADAALLSMLPKSETTRVIAGQVVSSAGTDLTSGAGSVRALGPGSGDELAGRRAPPEAVARAIGRAGEDFRGGDRYIPPGDLPSAARTWQELNAAQAAAAASAAAAGQAEDRAGQAAARAAPEVASLGAAARQAGRDQSELARGFDGILGDDFIAGLKAKILAARAGQLPAAGGAGGAGGGPRPPAPPGGLPPALPPGSGAGEPNPEDIGAMRAAEAELTRLRMAEHDAGEEANRTAGDWLRMAAAAESGAKAQAYLRAAALAWRIEQAAAAAATAGADQGIKDIARDIPPMVDGLIKSTGGWFGLNSQLRLFGGLLPGIAGHVQAWHVLVDFIIEGLAVFIPALVTLAADLTAFGVAGYDAGKQVYDRIVAIHTASDALDQSLAPMTGKLEALHDQVRPMVWELYGDAIDVVHAKTGLFNQLAILTGGVLDRLAAHVAVFAMSASKGLETFFAVGNQDLAKLGIFFDNIGKALLALIKVTQETHIDQIFLNFFVVLSQFLVLVTKLPTPILAVVFALHAFWLWGGLTATVIMQMLGPLRSLALALGAVDATEVAGGLASLDKDASAFTRLKAGLTDIGAGLGALPGRLNIFSRAAKDAGAAAGEAAAGEAEAAAGTNAMAGGFGTLLGIPVVGWLVALAAALVGVGVYLGLRTNQTQAWIESMDTALTKVNAFRVVGQTMSDLAAVTKQLAESQRSGAGDTTELANAQADLSTKLGNELDHVGQVSKAYGTTMPMALALLNAAGVKTSDLFTSQGKVWEQDLQQVRGLVDGYKAMGQGMSEIQRDVSVQLVNTSDQAKAMTTLNQAWDQFQKTVAGPFSGIIQVGQDLQGFAKDAAQAGASMTGLSGNSLTLQKDFQGTYTDVETLFSAIRMADAVTGDTGFSGAVKHAVQALIPLAGNNKAAAAEISQLAQEAGGPATTSLAALTKWAGNTHDPLAALYKDSQNATIAASNLDQDASRLTATLQSDLNPAMANAAFAALGGQKAFSTFAADLFKFGPDSQQTITAGHAVAQELLSIDKNSASAKAQFVGWAESMGMSKDQANKLWAEVSKGVGPVNSIRDSLAGAASAQAKLVKPGLWGQFEHDAMSAFDKIKAHPLTFAIAGAFNFIPGVTKGLDAAGSAITGFFGHTLPVLVTQTLPGMAKDVAGFFAGPFTSTVQGAWSHVWSALVSPVVHVFDDIKRAITTGFDGWWKTHGSALEAIWGSTVKDLKFIWDEGSSFVVGSAKKFWDQVSGIFSKGSAGVNGIASRMWKDIELVAQGFWGLFGPLIKSGWDIIAGIFRIAVSLVETVVKVGWDAIASAAKIAWAAIKAFLKITWDTIVAVFSVALDLLTGHWHQAWTDIENYGKQVLNALKSFFSASWNAIKTDTLQAWNAIKSGVTGIWGSIENAAKQVWNNLKSGFSNVVGSIKTTWGTLEKIFKGPVSFLVNTVYDSGIARLWNDVMGAIGGPKLPIIKFAGGGRLPGYGGGDTVPAWIRGGGPALLEPGEAVVDKERTRKYAHVLKAMGVPGFATGGSVPLPGGHGGGVPSGPHGQTAGPTVSGGIVHLLGDAFDVGKIVLALATGNTAALGNALSKLIGPGGASGELADMITGIPKTLIKDLLGKAKSAASASFSLAGSGAGGSATAGVKTVARYVMAHGGTKEAGAGVGGTVAGESGGNPEAIQGGGGGGTGLIQWTPGSSAFPIQPLITGNVGRDMAVQLADMLAYIDSRGGMGAINAGGVRGGPMGAAEVFSGMEAPLVPGSDIRPSVVAQLYAQGLRSGGVVGMASGGEVPYLAGFHAGQAHNILVAAGLRPVAASGQKANWWVTGSSPRATTHVAAHSPVTINAAASSRPSGIRVPYLAGYTAGTAHNILVAEGLVPTAASGQKATWIVTGSRPSGGSGAAHGMHVEIIAPKPKTPGPPSTTAPGGMDTAQAWNFYSSQLAKLGSDEDAAWRGLYNIKLPKAATAGQRANWAKDRKELYTVQRQMGLDRNSLVGSLGSPSGLTAARWNKLITEAGTVKAWEYGTHQPNWNWPAWHYAHPQWLKANQATASLQSGLGNSYKAWKALYGAGGTPAMYNTPGVLVTPLGGQPGPVDLSSLVMGGPSSPVIGSGSSGSATGMGFSLGGAVGGDGASLGQVASMFSLGGQVQDPTLSRLGLSPSAQRQLAGTSAGEMPRSLSDAAGERVGVKVGSMTINNPVAEKPSDTITRSTNRLAFLAGRGAV